MCVLFISSILFVVQREANPAESKSGTSGRRKKPKETFRERLAKEVEELGMRVLKPWSKSRFINWPCRPAKYLA